MAYNGLMCFKFSRKAFYNSSSNRFFIFEVGYIFLLLQSECDNYFISENFLETSVTFSLSYILQGEATLEMVL